MACLDLGLPQQDCIAEHLFSKLLAWTKLDVPRAGRALEPDAAKPRRVPILRGSRVTIPAVAPLVSFVGGQGIAACLGSIRAANASLLSRAASIRVLIAPSHRAMMYSGTQVLASSIIRSMRLDSARLDRGAGEAMVDSPGLVSSLGVQGRAEAPEALSVAHRAFGAEKGFRSGVDRGPLGIQGFNSLDHALCDDAVHGGYHSLTMRMDADVTSRYSPVRSSYSRILIPSQASTSMFM